MSIEIIDTLKPKNNGQFPVADTNDIRGGYYQVSTIAERDAIPQQRRRNGMMCYVENDSTRQHVYQLENGKWIRPTFAATNAVYVGDTQPADTTILWVDDTDEDVDNVLGESEILDEFSNSVAELKEQIADIHYAFTKDLDAGEVPIPGVDIPEEEPEASIPPGEVPQSRKVSKPKKSRRFSISDIKRAERAMMGISEEDSEEEDEDSEITLPTYKSGNINSIRIKRVAQKRYIPTDLKDGELIYCRDTRQLIICDNGKYVILGSTTGGEINPDNGGNNDQNRPNRPSDGNIVLYSPNNTKFRLVVNNDGLLQLINMDLENIELPTPDQNGRFAGLIVQQVYGGGGKDTNSTPVSHGFIELYNNTKDPMNLKGLSVQVADNMGTWNVLPLTGIIPAFSSFLIRCQRHSNEGLMSTRCKIKEYDMDWDILLGDKGLKVCIMVGTDPIAVANPYNGGENALPIEGYIDMIGSGGIGEGLVIDGYEERFGQYMDKYHSVQRVEYGGKKDANNNLLNCRSIDYRTCLLDIYGPRYTKSGPWYVDYDKLKIDPRRPNLLNIAYGEKHNTRIINWQAEPSRFGGVKYRKLEEEKFIFVPSTKEVKTFDDGRVIKHTVILRDLEDGIYEFQAGEEGRWSDLVEFEVKTYEENETIKFLQVTDQQGWDEFQYLAWKYSAQFIADNEEFDFVINTGDVAQNGNRAFEWRYYYEFAKPVINGKCHMSCIGNNDRIEKKDSSPFAWYTSYENSPYYSCYSWDVGSIHFVSLNSEELNAEQQAWFRDDIAKTDKRWVIVYMHVSPYTIIKTSKVQDWAPVFDECGVDLVICGHNHAYSRSKPMKAGVVNDGEGTYYVMANATGYKLSGKESIISPAPDWYAHVGFTAGPNYIMWEVTKEKIVMKSYYIGGMMPFELYEGGPLTRELYDTVEIPNRNLRG